MIVTQIFFWLIAAVLAYVYLGYPCLILLLKKVKESFRKSIPADAEFELPTVTLMVTAYNEENWLKTKIKNAFDLDYPKGKLKVMIVNDGSTDGSEAIINGFPDVIHVHEHQRRGKMAAISRAMDSVDTDIVVYSDANTLLNREAIREIARFFNCSRVGCVCGEKRLFTGRDNDAASAGEGTYWRYESMIKAAEAQLGFCVGATGELFAIRTSLFRKPPDDTLLDDFVISMDIALQGSRVQYAPHAYAIESASAGIHEEFKRKVRIAAGNLQAIRRMPELLNPFKTGMLAFQYFSHKFLRSIIGPLLFIVIFFLNLLLVSLSKMYEFLLVAQVIFYVAAGVGYLLRKQSVSSRLFFIPLYLTFMNTAALIGMVRYFQGRQTALWEKSHRKNDPV